MNSLIKILRGELQNAIDRIDNGTCDLNGLDIEALIQTVRDCTHRDKPLSKYAACEYLNISRATFDNLVSEGKIPKGVHEQGFKELSWYKKDLDAYKEKYRNKVNK